MDRDFAQITWDTQLEDDCRQLVRLAIREDLERWQDWTTLALIPAERTGEAAIAARSGGVAAGLQTIPTLLRETHVRVEYLEQVHDGESFESGAVLGTLRGCVRDILTCERVVLNLVGRLTGIATRTRDFVRAVAGTPARVYDTRKTTPGWRRLEKYAVRCGGGHNHRTGLYDAFLIKDNHLAFAECATAPELALERVREFVQTTAPHYAGLQHLLLEIEVDSLAQLRRVLPGRPDLVLLDNMSPAELAEAVAIRNAAGATCELEASGGVTLATIRTIAQSGVERISVGSLTHGAASLDIGLDWRPAALS